MNAAMTMTVNTAEFVRMLRLIGRGDIAEEVTALAGTVREDDAGRTHFTAMPYSAEGEREHIAQAMDRRTAIEDARQRACDQAAEVLAAVAQEDYRWQTRDRGVSNAAAAREVGDLVELAACRIENLARERFHRWYQEEGRDAQDGTAGAVGGTGSGGIHGGRGDRAERI